MWDVAKRDELKRPGFVPPFVDAFILADTIFVDPTSFEIPRTEGIVSDWAMLTEELRKQKIIQPWPLTNVEYNTCITEATKDLVTFIGEFGEKITQEARKFNYAYLLESPWWLFIRDIDPILRESFDYEALLRKKGNAIRGLLPFLFSTLLVLRVKQKVDIPILFSPISSSLFTKIKDITFEKLSQMEDLTTSLNSVFRIFKENQPKVVNVKVPSFYEICSHETSSNIAILKRALTLRRDPDCKWFRRKFWESMDYIPNNNTQWETLMKEEINEASERLAKLLQPRYKSVITNAVIDFALDSPISILLSSWPLSSIVSTSFSTILNVFESYWNSRKFGWYSFLFRAVYLPPTKIE